MQVPSASGENYLHVAIGIPIPGDCFMELLLHRTMDCRFDLHLTSSISYLGGSPTKLTFSLLRRTWSSVTEFQFHRTANTVQQDKGLKTSVFLINY